jgi:hypothetical protein
MLKMSKKVFNTDGSWTAPAGVTNIIALGMGGGAGGQAGANGSAGAGSYSGHGGVGQHLQPTCLTVVPNTTYTVTIGAGGTGGTGSDLAFGTAGGNTSFGALMTWVGAPTTSSSVLGYVMSSGVWPVCGSFSSGLVVCGNAAGGVGVYHNSTAGSIGSPNYTGNVAATGTATPSATTGANGGSGMSGEGIGGTGGTGVNNGNGGNGGDAAANSGGGGGGGAGGGATSKTRGSGGNGGSGQLIIMWIE